MSYARREDLPPAEPIRYYTAAELHAMVPPHVDWIVRPGLMALGAITEVDGKIKAAGKTTLSLYIVKAIVSGADFLGAPTRKARVVYVTEQSRETFTDALRRAGMERCGDELRVIVRSDIGGTDWPDVVAQTMVDGFDVCVFDTIGKLAGIVNENDAHEWAEAMAPLQDLAASGRAVLIDRHDRKGGGEVGESGRGSSQGSGDVDIILALRRPEGNQPNTRRVIEALSRYQETPEKIVVELRSDGYAMLGDNEAVAHADALKFIRFLLTYELETKAFPVPSAALIARAKTEKGLSESSVRRAAGELVGLGELAVTGAGVKGSPHVYDRPVSKRESDSFHSQTSKETNELAAPANGGNLDARAAFERYQRESSGGMWQSLDGRRPA